MDDQCSLRSPQCPPPLVANLFQTFGYVSAPTRETGTSPMSLILSRTWCATKLYPMTCFQFDLLLYKSDYAHHLTIP